MKGVLHVIQVVAVVFGTLCPIALAALGYLSIFRELSWIYLVIVLGVYVVCVFALIFSTMQEKRYAIYCEMMSGGMGWVWMLSILASLWFFVSALFMDGSWWEFGYSFLVGGLCKGWARSFQLWQEADRVESINNDLSA